MKKSSLIIPVFLFLFPLFAFAEGLDNLLIRIGSLILLLIPLVVSLALLYFLWGLANFILAGDDKEKIEKGKSTMLWGIIALFVMVSVWGIVRFIQDTLKIEDLSAPGNVKQLIPR